MLLRPCQISELLVIQRIELNTTMDDIEWAILAGRTVDNGNDEAITLANAIVSGDYAKVLASQSSRLLFGTDAPSTEPSVAQFDTSLDPVFYIQERLKLYDARDQRKQFLILCCAIACLHAFIQSNYTGPEFPLKVVDILPSAVRDTAKAKKLNTHAVSSLECDGEQAYHLTPKATYLLIADILLQHSLPSLETASWWRARGSLLRQRILEEYSATLHDRIFADLKKTREQYASRLAEEQDLRVRLNIEEGLVHHYYQEGKEAAEMFREAGIESGMQWELTGRLGKRTKFQQTDISQLVVLAESRKREAPSTTNGTAVSTKTDLPIQPETLPLNDDTLLESTKFTSSHHDQKTQDSPLSHVDPNKQSALHPLDQSILLGLCLNVKNTNPAHGLTNEQMMPYVQRVIIHPENWMVHTMSLLIRSRLEANKSRTVERSVLQIQALVDQMKLEESGQGADKGASVRERLECFWALEVPAKWELEKELAERMVSIGVIRSALEIFERLEMWEQVVHCYQLMEREDKAKRIIMERLKSEPESPKLWCILGDITKDPEHWQKSWHLSKNRYSKAQRALGGYYYAHGQYRQAIMAYALALAINPLFENTWFIYGCAGMQMGDWEVARQAFSRSVSLDPDNSEAWNNLGSIYLKEEPPRKADALHAFKEATRGKFDSWRIWSNYMAVCCDMGEFGEAARALARVVDLRATKVANKEEAVDLEVLNRIVDGVTRNPLNSSEDETRRLSVRLQSLLERNIMPQVSSVVGVWKAAGRLYLWKGDWDKALDAELKAYRVLSNDPALDVDAAKFAATTLQAVELVDAYRNYGPRTKPGSDELVCADWAYQAKTLLRSLIGKTKAAYDGTADMDTLQETLKDVKSEQ